MKKLYTKTITDLSFLLKFQVGALYSSEKLQLTEWRSLSENIAAPWLRNLVARHLQSSEEQQTQLKRLLITLEGDLEAKPDSVQEDLVESGWDMIGRSATKDVMDAGLFIVLQQVVYHQVANLNAAKWLALKVGHAEVARSLQHLTDHKLILKTELARADEQMPIPDEALPVKVQTLMATR